MDKNYYEILEINTDATESEIKTAFRKLARKWHPDVAGNTQEVIAKFKKINEAYEILSDFEKRKKYDAIRGILHNVNQQVKDSKNTNYKDDDSKSSKTKDTSQKQNQEEKQNTKEKHSKNTFQEAWEVFMQKTQQQSNKSKQNKHYERKINGSNITSEITITVSESIQGTTRTVNILHTEPCPKCHGHKFANGTICPTCNGTSEVSIHKKVSVKIPEHVKQGAKIRIAGEGNKGINGGKPGDLYLIIKINTNSSPFSYDGLNILQTVPVEPHEAVLGSTIEIKSPTGKINMKLSSGTMNGQKYRLANQGLEKNGKKGDMIVTISIEIPKNLTKDEVLLYEKLRQISNHNIRENIDE